MRKARDETRRSFYFVFKKKNHKDFSARKNVSHDKGIRYAQQLKNKVFLCVSFFCASLISLSCETFFCAFMVGIRIFSLRRRYTKRDTKKRDAQRDTKSFDDCYLYLFLYPFFAKKRDEKKIIAKMFHTINV